MNLNAKTLLALALALSAVGTAIFMMQDHTGADEAGRALLAGAGYAEDRVESLTADVKRLSAEVAAMRRQQWAQAPASTLAASVKEEERNDLLSKHERRRTHVERRAEEIRQLDAHVRGEARDPAWSQKVEQQLAKVLRSESAQGSTLRRVERGITLCRIEIAHEDRAALDRFSQALPSSLPFNLSGFVDIEKGSNAVLPPSVDCLGQRLSYRRISNERRPSMGPHPTQIG